MNTVQKCNLVLYKYTPHYESMGKEGFNRLLHRALNITKKEVDPT
jgi:hypothetical protein